MRFILRAFRLFSRERGLWKYAVKPLLWGALAYLIVILLTAGVGAKLGESIGSRLGASAQTGGTVGALLGLTVTIVLGSSIYLAMVGLISGFGFDSLSREVEERTYGHVVGKSPTFGEGLSDGIGRAILAGAVGIVALCGTATVVIPWLAASFLALMDFTAPALMRRGVTLGKQFGVARRIPGAMGFAGVSGIILMIPVINVLALPVLVTAATLLVADESK